MKYGRYVIDNVLLATGLDATARLSRLHTAGLTFLSVVVISNRNNTGRHAAQLPARAEGAADLPLDPQGRGDH
jgi:hypothetical protein